jgi:hypothetical protein
MDPQLDVWCVDRDHVSPLVSVIFAYSPRLLELHQVIKSYEPAHYKAQIQIQMNSTIFTQLQNATNRHACDPNQSTICALVGQCGELIPNQFT